MCSGKSLKFHFILGDSDKEIYFMACSYSSQYIHLCLMIESFPVSQIQSLNLGEARKCRVEN